MSRRKSAARKGKTANKAIAAILAEVPTNWCDPLLTGPDAVLKGPPWWCPDVERLLNAIRKRQADAAKRETMSDLLRVIERALLERMDTYHHDPARLAAHIAAALAAAAPPPDRNDLPGRRSRSEPTRCGRLAFVASRRAFDHRGKRMTDSLPPINGTRGAAPDFYDGILAALAVVDAHGAQTVGQSIVNTVDKAKLFARADAYDREVLASLGIKP